MAKNVVIRGVGNQTRAVSWLSVSSNMQLSLVLDAVASVSVRRGGGAAAGSSAAIPVSQIRGVVPIGNGYSLAGLSFALGSRHVVRNDGNVQRNIEPTTGIGTTVGSVSGGAITLTNWMGGISPEVQNLVGAATPPIDGVMSPFGAYEVVFRTAVAPLRPGSVSVLGTLMDGTTFNVVANDQGFINTSRVKGRVNYTSGVVTLFFVSPTAASAAQQPADLSFLGIPGVSTVWLVRARVASLRYNAVAFNYMPLDASLLGIDPVRLPSDGRVPIFRPGGLAVVGNTKYTAAFNATNGQTVALGRTGLSRVRVLDANDATINTGYTADLAAGTVTFSSVAGYAQPIYIEHRVENMVQVRDAQINGDISFNPALSHDFASGESYISSAVPAGDLRARVSRMFDQQTWDGITFSDSLSGSAALATYNDALSPVIVTNAGAETERWVLRFTSTTAFQIIGENVGVIGTGSTSTDTAPINPVTGEPYWTLPALGWGAGWAIGNIVRLDTVGARFPFWCVRTVRQGAAPGEDYSFSLLTRGDVDNPI